MCITDTLNVYFAFRTVLIAILKADLAFTDIYVPELGTGIGKVLPETCAKQMQYAYNSIINSPRYLDLVQQTRKQFDLTKKIEILKYT
jgi:hypothetical protein